MSEIEPLTADAIMEMFAASPFIAALEMEVTSLDTAQHRISLRMPMTAFSERGRSTNQFHGGALASFVDVAGDFAVALAVGGAVPTIDLRVDYLRPAFGPYVDAHATARRVGRTVGIADIDVHGADGKLVTIGRGCYSAKIG
ncbi:MAG: PaaI family thioesterase [Pseudomonadota bacterium]